MMTVHRITRGLTAEAARTAAEGVVAPVAQDVAALDSRVTALEGGGDALTVVSTGPVDLDDAAPVGSMRGFVVTADGVVIEGTTTTAGTWVAVKEAAASGDASGWVLYQAGAGGGSTGTTDTTPPSAITGLTVTATAWDTITASWATSTDAESPASYKARITPSGGTAGAWRTVTGTSTVFTGLSGSTAYTVEVYATSAGGATATSSKSATTPVQQMTYAERVAADGATHYWPLATSGADSVGSMAMSALGGAAFTGPPLGDGAASARIPTGGLLNATGAAIDVSNPFSFEALVRLATVGGSGSNWPIFAVGTHLSLCIYEANLFAIDPIGLAGGVQWSAGTTRHVALTWDGSTWRVYVNGAQVSTGSQASWPTTGPTSIGGRNGVERGFDGSIAGVAAYGTALTAAQVLAHAQSAGVA